MHGTFPICILWLPRASSQLKSFKQIVRKIRSTTAYGSQLELGRRSSKYPFPSSETPRGIRIEHPRLATPALKSWIDDVSCKPVKRRSLSFPPRGSYALIWEAWFFDNLSIAAWIAEIPPSLRVDFVEMFVWAPAPFQSLNLIAKMKKVREMSEKGKMSNQKYFVTSYELTQALVWGRWLL